MRAGPTSSARCAELGAREDTARAAVGGAAEEEAFAALQSLVNTEMRRIHRLYFCCLLRCMVMPTRFAYLRDVRSTKGSTPRQPIPSHIRPENNGDVEYLAWLFGEIQPLQDTFSKQISAVVSKLNRAVWVSDVGLSLEQFPYKIWRGEARSKLHEDEGLYMGEILAQGTRVTSARFSALQVPGKLDRQVVDPVNLRACRGAGVLIPGPLKREQRCRDEITTDYEGKDAWPPAASLVDIVRCCIAFDDPSAMAVMVALLQKEFDVVRVKNRFENDEVVEVSPETMQAEFYAAETSGTDSTDENATNSEKMYRDVNLNLRLKGSQFVFEVQLTLTGISILKKSEQKIYTLARMASAEELLGTFVFSEHREFVVPISKSISDPSGATASAGEPVPEKDLLGLEDEEFVNHMPVLVEEGATEGEEEDWLEQGFKLDVNSRSPAVGQAPVLSMDAKDEQERAEDVHALVGRLHKRNHILSQLSCVCCAKEEHAGSQASARPDNPPNERYFQAP